jgi:hypothetical protein
MDGRSALSQGRYLYKTTKIQNKCGQTSISRVGFEPTIPGVERAKIFYAGDLVATAIGCIGCN